ncbi:MAG: hypothetical protein AB4060_22385 [Crocosphaera sp.]
MYTTSLQHQQFTPQQQEFLEQYQVESLINGERESSYELWSSIHEASIDYFSLDEWEAFCSTYSLC